MRMNKNMMTFTHSIKKKAVTFNTIHKIRKFYIIRIFSDLLISFFGLTQNFLFGNCTDISRIMF